jgi:hypothetical protein
MKEATNIKKIKTEACGKKKKNLQLVLFDIKKSKRFGSNTNVLVAL